MIRCARCGRLIRRDPLCTDLAVITAHWMSGHPAAWARLHPAPEDLAVPAAWPDGQPVTPWADPWHDVAADIRQVLRDARARYGRMM